MQRNVKENKETMKEVCATCLSEDRRLVPLQSTKFKEAALNVLNMNFIPSASMLCWECTAELTHHARFRARALVAQRALHNSTHVQPLKCLSTLSTCPQTDVIHYVSPDYVDQDMKQEISLDHNLGLAVVKLEKVDTIGDKSLDFDENRRRSLEFEPEHLGGNVSDNESSSDDDNPPRNAVTRVKRVKPEKNVIGCKKSLGLHENLLTTLKIELEPFVEDAGDSSSDDQKPLVPPPRHLEKEHNYSRKKGTEHQQQSKPCKTVTKKHQNSQEKRKKNPHAEPSTSKSAVPAKRRKETEKKDAAILKKEKKGKQSFVYFKNYSDTDSALTDSDIGDNDVYSGLPPRIEQKSSKRPLKKVCKYNINMFRRKKISLDRAMKNRELDKKARGYRKPFKCETCIKGFETKTDFLAHCERFHSMLAGPHQCPICCVHFKTKSRLQEHYERHLLAYGCRKCKYTHYSIRVMHLHDKRRHSDSKQTFACKHCAQEFPTPAALNYHSKQTHGIVKFNGVTERRPKKRKCKKSECDPDSLPQCRICNKTFLNKSYVAKHERSHAEPPRRQERECPRCGIKVRFLEAHIAKVHERSEDAYCAECDIQFPSAYIYRHNHLKYSRRHNPVRDVSKLTIPCPYCDKKWHYQRDLDRHVMSHTKEYPFICDLCGKGFAYEKKLKNHVQANHEGIPKAKDKICSFCGKAFAHQQVLKQHMRVHTGEKPYECALCPWKFTQRTALVTHMKGKHPDHFGKTVIPKKKQD